MTIAARIASRALADDLAHAVNLDMRGEQHDALDVLYLAVDDHLIAGEFGAVNDAFPTFDLERLSIVFMLGILSISRTAFVHLPGYSAFFERVKARLTAIAPERVDGLLQGLER